jgi:hypothetical protein
LGKVNANLLFPCWLLYKVSPDISGTYYVFSLAGQYPQRVREAPGYSRSGLRNRIEWTVDYGALDELHPKFTPKFDSTHTKPANASVARDIRPWDIPLVGIASWNNGARQDEVLVPTHWDSLGVQIHPESTHRLNNHFMERTAPSLIAWGKAVVEILAGTKLDQSIDVEAQAIWKRLQEILSGQHVDARRHYKGQVERMGRELEEDLLEEAKGVYLAFSLLNLHGPEDPKKVNPRGAHNRVS